MRRAWALAAALALGTVALYAPVRGFGFLGFDDAEYVVDNVHVRGGLHVDGVLWAFGHAHVANWHPLTWLSHMLDCSLFGVSPSGPHVENAVLHALNAGLLLVALRSLTGATGASAAVAALFAVHPLRVESVAWIAERKDVLCGLAFVLALAAYARYAARPGPRTALPVVASFVAGLLAKPMIVTLPLVLLVLDWWPLGRVRDRRSLARCALEKAPLLALSAAVGAITVGAQAAGGAVGSLAQTPLGLRAANAVVSVGGYVVATAWPARLAVLYPFPRALPATAVVAAGVLLGAVSALAVALARWAPWVLAGWLWFVVMLVPVSGIAKFGQQASADRYTYLPSIGLLVAAVWTVDALSRTRARRAVAAATSAGLVVGLAVATRRQLAYWRDDLSLWTRAVAVTRENCVAETNLATALMARGDVAAARPHLDDAVALCPTFAKAHANRAIARDAAGEHAAAMAELAEAVRLDPADPVVWYDRGVALGRSGDLEGAAASHARAVQLDPDFVDAHANLAWALAETGRPDAAAAEYRIAVRLAPERRDLVARLAALSAATSDGPR